MYQFVVSKALYPNPSLPGAVALTAPIGYGRRARDRRVRIVWSWRQFLDNLRCMPDDPCIRTLPQSTSPLASPYNFTLPTCSQFSGEQTKVQGRVAKLRRKAELTKEAWPPVSIQKQHDLAIFIWLAPCLHALVVFSSCCA